MLVLLNTLALAGAAGYLYYTRILYQRPQITEAGEREKLAQVKASPTPPAKPTLLHYEPFTVNIAATPARPQAADGTSRQLEGKMHYATVGMSIELRDESQKDLLNEVKPQMMDRLLALIGRKQFSELATVQGRYVLRTQMVETINAILNSRLSKNRPREPLILNVYFNQFVVQ